MKHLGLCSLLSVATAGLIALSFYTGCASDEDPADNGTAGSGTGGDGTGGDGTGGDGTGGDGTGGDGTGGSAGGGSCPAGQDATVANVADGTVGVNQQVDIEGAIATTEKLLVSWGSAKQTCLWGVFVRDPATDRGLMVVAYGANAPSADECEANTDVIPDVAIGDTIDFVGTVNSYSGGACTDKPQKPQPQVQVRACSATKGPSAGTPAPRVVTDLNGIAAGKAEYQGMLVRIENVDAENWPDGGTIGTFGKIQIANSNLVIANGLYYKAAGQAQFDEAQHFNSITGVVQLSFCEWVIQPRDKCTDFDPPSKDCP